jgi:Lon protease-like protein
VVGTSRVRVGRWLADDPYPLADVAEWPDEAEPPPDLATHVAELYAQLANLTAIARDVGHPIHERLVDLPPPAADAADASALYEIAARCPLGAADRYRILAAPSAAERCDVIADALEDAVALLRFGRT